MASSCCNSSLSSHIFLWQVRWACRVSNVIASVKKSLCFYAVILCPSARFHEIFGSDMPSRGQSYARMLVSKIKVDCKTVRLRSQLRAVTPSLPNEVILYSAFCTLPDLDSML